MTTTLYLIRHGKTQWNLEKRMQGSQNSPLTQDGIDQAMKLSEKLRTIEFDVYLTSSSKRAQETAQLVFPNNTIVDHPAFTEINMGSWEGKTFQEIEALNPTQWHNFFKDPLAFEPDSGESFEELYDRVSDALNELLIEFKGQSIAIVSHRITIKMMIEYLLKGSMQELGEAEDILPNSLTIIEVNDTSTQVLLRSDISHYNRVGDN